MVLVTPRTPEHPAEVKLGAREGRGTALCDVAFELWNTLQKLPTPMALHVFFEELLRALLRGKQRVSSSAPRSIDLRIAWEMPMPSGFA